MDGRGYSLRVVRANEQADLGNIGVLLGRACIKKEIPVAEVADFFGVSRMTIYNWFTGIGQPRKRLHGEIEKIIQKLSG